MPKLIMLVGLPGCGKSTFSETFRGERLSTDAIIEKVAFDTGKTYNAVFGQWIDTATLTMNNHLKEILLGEYDGYHGGNKPNIIWDQTNLTPKTRKSKLAKIPDYYEKIAIYFETDDEIILKRNDQRMKTGRGIPLSVLWNMKTSLVPPSKSEGFDYIYTIKVE